MRMYVCKGTSLEGINTDVSLVIGMLLYPDSAPCGRIAFEEDPAVFWEPVFVGCVAIQQKTQLVYRLQRKPPEMSAGTQP